MFLLHSLLFITIIIPSTIGYIFVEWNSAVSWNVANNFCYTVYKTHLASIHSQSDNDIVTDLCSTVNGHCYIGLQIDLGPPPPISYSWSDGTPYDYPVNWSTNNPSGDNGQQNTCGSIINSTYDDVTCSDAHAIAFVCNEYVTTRFIVEWTSMNWTNAENYCQTTYNSHLATIVNDYENNEASKWLTVQNGQYWFGLHDQLIENIWRFISGPHSKYEDKYYNWNVPWEPNNAGNEDCGEFTIKWNDYLCWDNRWFMCDGYQFGFTGGSFFSYTGIERLNGITKWGHDGSSYQAFIIESFTVDNINNITQNEYRTGRIGDWGIAVECNSFILGNNEYINEISLYFDTSWAILCGLEFVTNLNNTYQCARDINCYKYNTIKYSDSYLSGFYGRYGAFIDSINYNMNKLPYPQTFSPTKAPTQSPTNVPTYSPTNAPTNNPSNNPTYSPTNFPTYSPTYSPTLAPTDAPTNVPSNFPTYSPTNNPTNAPTIAPTNFPSNSPTLSPSNTPTNNPSNAPSISPTISPSIAPTMSPTLSPSQSPTLSPSNNPTNNPTYSPTNIPTNNPTNSPLDSTTQTLPPQNNLTLNKNLTTLIIALILGGIFCVCVFILLCYLFKKKYDESIRNQVLHNLSSMSGMSTLQTLPSQTNMDRGMSITEVNNGLSYVDHAAPAYSSDNYVNNLINNNKSKHEFENGIQMATIHTYEKEGNDTRIINNDDEKAEIEDSKEDMYGTKDNELYEGNGREKGQTIGGDTAGPAPPSVDDV